MLKMTALLLTSIATISTANAAGNEWQCPSNLKQSRPTLEAGRLDLCDTVKHTKALLVVNTASMCGFTPQFSGLEALYQEFKDRGLLILGVPTADFGGQEYDDASKTSKVCHANYGVSFPVFHKSCIHCDKPDPLLTLVATASGVTPEWNFYKYIFNPSTGESIGFDSATTPDAKPLRDAITKFLGEH
ncbi:Hydroperoxy fatty acid reductase gpx1 [Zhongshania aliphaticivorans]|uniref:Glutathione peroxidase n=1 Tax=Zhongshania aliphaticivorans TaxID=1470434 RepID=A0A5S9N9K4_9GAMM|nr:glutathione peroxidase [Zhongshania aliphaticivorans]CAA0078246.1 Hydroperoxy fatty acid reductase gpx1 [Zhongshania aliphaticivorans]CAA0086780.1 Hydroperoxy fatty acid reductase gpx1 [Zhongshania aliphaticivorans]